MGAVAAAVGAGAGVEGGGGAVVGAVVVGASRRAGEGDFEQARKGWGLWGGLVGLPALRLVCEIRRDRGKPKQKNTKGNKKHMRTRTPLVDLFWMSLLLFVLGWLVGWLPVAPSTFLFG